jgi:hypothetical protein
VDKEYLMKRVIFAGLALIAALGVYGQAEYGTLNEAVYGAAQQILKDLPKGQTIVVYQFDSHNQRLSDHVLKELFNALVNSRRFTVLDRSAQEVIDAELYYQFNTSAGMISDDSLASLTKRIGAQAIVTGFLDDTVYYYSFRARVIGTETTEAISSFTAYVDKDDSLIMGFEGRKNTGQKILIGAFNMMLGLGSYIEGDIWGGASITAGYAAAVGLILTEIKFLDWGDPMVGVPITAGFTVAGLSLVYGFARPFIYYRVPRVAAVLDNAKVGIAVAQDANGNRVSGFQAAYTIKC